MLHTVLMTSLTPLSNTDEMNCWDNRPFTAVWPDPKPKKSQDITRTIKKKPKRVRTAYTTDQLKSLERIYSSHKYIDSESRKDLAKRLNIGEKCIKIWFQNRRMKEKRESSESSSDTSSEIYDVVATPVQNNQVDGPCIPNQFENYETNPDPIHYQLPPYYQYDNNVYEGQNGQVNSHTFHSDTNVYPTQYYPCMPDTGGANCFSEFGSDLQNYWASVNYDMGYY